MAPLSKLTLTSYRRTQPNRDPIEEWLYVLELVVSFNQKLSSGSALA